MALPSLLLMLLTLSNPTEEANPPEVDPVVEKVVLDLFPARLFSHAEAVALYSAERLGEPARAYDLEMGVPGTDLERAVEDVLLGRRADELEAPPALRRFSRLAMEGYRQGRLQPVQVQFLAEFCGLAAVPEVVGYFTTGSSDPAAMADLVDEVVGAEILEPETRAVAVTLEELPGEVKGWAGVVTSLSGAVESQAFPRAVPAGATVHLEGRLRGKGKLTGLFVNQPQGEVEIYELPEEKGFKVDVPMPAEPGVYRAALNRVKKHGFPDSPYFFSFYVGVDPPRAYQPPEISAPLQEAAAASRGAKDPKVLEAGFYQAVNELRARYGRGPVDVVGEPDRLRSVLENLPKQERAAYKYVNKHLKEDPLPQTGHGIWGAGLGLGWDVNDVAWLLTEHPVARRLLLEPIMTQLVVGARPARDDLDFFTLLYVLVQAAPRGDDVRQYAWLSMAGVWDGEAPKEAPKLQAVLDGVAEQVASGEWNTKKASSTATSRIVQQNLVSGRFQLGVFVVPPELAPDLSGFLVPPGARYLAIGRATGKVGQGPTQATVLVVVAAEAAE